MRFFLWLKEGILGNLWQFVATCWIYGFNLAHVRRLCYIKDKYQKSTEFPCHVWKKDVIEWSAWSWNTFQLDTHYTKINRIMYLNVIMTSQLIRSLLDGILNFIQLFWKLCTGIVHKVLSWNKMYLRCSHKCLIIFEVPQPIDLHIFFYWLFEESYASWKAPMWNFLQWARHSGLDRLNAHKTWTFEGGFDSRKRKEICMYEDDSVRELGGE